MDYSFLPSLKAGYQAHAIRLDFTAAANNAVGWDYQARYSTSAQYAILNDLFVVTLKAGTTYDLFSSSYFDPFILTLYNSSGAVIAADSDGGTYGSDMIFHFVPTVTADYYISASWDQGAAASHRYVSVSVYEDSIPSTVAPPPPGAVVTKDGTAGIDRFVLAGKYDDYTVTPTSNKLTMNKKATGEVQVYTNVERLTFTDKSVAYDIDGNAGNAYRLYKAAFDRAPDTAGLGFWIKELDKGTSLDSVAQQFISSNEFQGMYGAGPTNAAFVAALYTNVLGRPGEAAGLSYWVGQMNSGALTDENVLVGFAASTENKIAVQGLIQQGIEYQFLG